ncbi:MAG: hypothetical protein Q7R85_04700 [bacterium]|nr:hypothetical protein [bacterium]
MDSQRTIDLLAEKEADTVAMLSELGFDTDFFDEGAWNNLLAFAKKSPWITGYIVDGALTRLDRPEILNKDLTHWHKSKEECEEESIKVKSRDRLEHMQGIQLGILQRRLAELRKAAPKAKIVVSESGDDIQHSFSRLLNAILLRSGEECEEEIGRLNRKCGELKKQAKGMEKTKKNLVKDVKPEAKVSTKVTRKLQTVEKDLGNIGAALGKLNTDIDAMRKKQALYREPKEGPTHQYETKKLVEGFYASVGAICKGVGAEFTNKQGVLTFGDLRVDYAHGRHKTWATLLRIEECMVAATHGKQQHARRLAGAAIKDLVRVAEETRPDVILESGHHGKGFKRYQRLKTMPDEVNYKNQMKYDSERTDDGVTLVCALPFENQARIARFVKGEEPVRMSGGKPQASRSHAVFNRYHNNGVSGLTIISKPKGAPVGVVATRWIQYNDFLTGAVLEQPSEFAAFSASADEHIGAREAEDMTRAGFVEMHKTYLAKPFVLCGSAARIRGYVNGGDAADANHNRWPHVHSAERDPHELMLENMELMANVDQSDPDAVRRAAEKVTNDSKGGTVESMDVILDWLADYFDKLLLPTLAQPGAFKIALVAVDGNHTRKALDRTGIIDWSFFVQRCKAREIGVFRTVQPDYYKADPMRGVRVAVGGHDNASYIFIKRYGLGADGKLVSGMRSTIDIVVQHDPKGYSGDGAVNAGRSSDADLAICGHTHDGYVKCDKTDENTFRVACRLATLEGVTPTELYFAGVPRTQAAHVCAMPKPGDFMELTIPAEIIQRIGREASKEESRGIVERVKANRKKGSGGK